MAALLCDALRCADEFSARHGGAAGAGPLAGAARQHNGSGFGENAKSAAVLQKGDVLLQVDGKPCRTVYALSDLFDGTEKTHTMKVLRGGEVVSLPP